MTGDGDHNVLYPLGGNNRVRGRGGDDALVLADTDARNSARGDLGDDVITMEAYASGTVHCGPGRDRIEQRLRGSFAPRQPDPQRDRGPWISASCEQLGHGVGSFAIDPVPDDPPSGRMLAFDRPGGARYGQRFRMDVSGTGPPFDAFASAPSRRRGITVKLPRRVAREVRQQGFSFRAEIWDERSGRSKLRLLWRFRQQA
jgi:hypothetical protein